MRRVHMYLAFFTLAAIIPGQSGYPQDATVQAAAKPTSTVLVVPAETTIPMTLRNTINSRTAQPGQGIYCQTIYPITVGNRIVIPVGSSVKGSVTQVVRPGRLKGKAQIGIRFQELILPNGTTLPLRATLSGFGGTGREGFSPKESKVTGASKGDQAGKVAQTTISGAEIGTLAGLGSHHALEGLGIGSAAGAAAGLVWLSASRGKEIVLPSGTSLELQLGEPLSFNRDDLGPPSRYDSGPALPSTE